MRISRMTAFMIGTTILVAYLLVLSEVAQRAQAQCEEVSSKESCFTALR
jgi:hypothetical protein